MVNRIYGVIRDVNNDLHFNKQLPYEITFIHSRDLYLMYPELTPEQREFEITKKHGAVFIIGIGGAINPDGQKHGGRSAEYDDWTTNETGKEFYGGLNGDIIVWHDALQ